MRRHKVLGLAAAAIFAFLASDGIAVAQSPPPPAPAPVVDANIGVVEAR